MTKRTPAINKALKEMKQAARQDIAKRCILHFRIDEASILELYEIAGIKKQPIGALLREWMLERLDEEKGNLKQKKTSQNKGYLSKYRSNDNKLLQLETRLSLLEKQILKK